MTRRTIPILLAVATLVVALAPVRVPAQEVPELQINSQRYIVIDAETGQVYAQRGADDQVAIASLTKVFTAVQAINMAPLDTKITTSESDLQGPNATVMGFGPGETYTLEDLIYGMMLPSGNDAAWAIARSLGYQDGDTDEQAAQRFIDLMNQRIQAMGLTNTVLKNPDGWGVPGHHSSAADVAAFMQYALQYPFLVEVMGTRSYTTSNGLVTVSNTNRLLTSYGPLLAGKTGYDDDSGWCLVNVAENGGTRVIAVTLDGIAPGDWYDDNRVLLEYGFRRKSEVASTGSFDGDIVAYTDPDAGQLANVGSTSASIADVSAAVGDFEPPETTGRIVTQEDNPRRIDASRSGPWLAGIAATALVGLSGAWRWAALGGTGQDARDRVTRLTGHIRSIRVPRRPGRTR
jgi:D-alanyl-D-alanine carboxypeptidase (penicillin-binding protein 5/6)